MNLNQGLKQKEKPVTDGLQIQKGDGGMKKEDFKKGQTVYILLVGNAARNKTNLKDWIEEWEVLSVGRKYITAKSENGCRDAKFEIDNNFREHTKYSENYKLYLSREEIEKSVWRSKTKQYIILQAKWTSNTLNKMSDEDLQKVLETFKKYDTIELEKTK